jgi:hypothetical protein
MRRSQKIWLRRLMIGNLRQKIRLHRPLSIAPDTSLYFLLPFLLVPIAFPGFLEN